ncbi:electron transfer flavoprotein beta subunit [Frankia sp. Hr75.2]|nr:electron transfer flavoprotein beta subunit [Frankia sp. Hr75.2]
MTVRRETDEGVTILTTELPAVVSVNEKINESRYPSFKGIMAAKRKLVTTLALAGAGSTLRGSGCGSGPAGTGTSAGRRSTPR